MGHTKTTRGGAPRALLGACAFVLLCFAFSSQALAAPVHPRAEALDIEGLNHACGVAVDSKGDLYLSSAGDSKIKVYNPSHTLLTEITDANTPCGLAVTTTGALYVTEKATGNVVRFKPNAYPFSGPLTYGAAEPIDSSGKAKGIAVDPKDNRLYVAEGTRVSSYGVEGNLGIDEVQRVNLTNTTGGTFKLKFGGQETGAIPFNASAAEVKAALEALSSIGAGNVGVERPIEKEFLVTFAGALAHTDVEALVGNATGLIGSTPKVNVEESAKGWGGRIAEGALTEATGLAAYTYSSGSITERYLWVADAAGVGPDHLDLFGGQNVRSLSLRRELNGASTPDGSFEFGSSGAYLTADPGNRNSAGKCVAVGEQACSAGHLFLYDAGHEALDELDAFGEYLDQTHNAAFADAEPTAIAVDRSGGANDGTLYVTAGPGAGAKALAFGPLKAPNRATLPKYPEGLSRELKNAQSVATDSQGDLYALAGGVVHVYGPDGAEIASFEDEFKPRAVAVDSAGNVYVLDEAFEGGVDAVTYYEPSSPQPEAGTTWSRFEPPIVTSKEFPENNKLIKRIAVIPGPAPGKDRLLACSGGTDRYCHLYDPAAEGSALLDEEFARSVLSDAPTSIAVNGATGVIYFGINRSDGGQVVAVDEEGTSLLARFDIKGSPSGKTSPNPSLAVDQASGHVLSYDGVTGTAHEYDAAGSFVAEFGNFTENISRSAGIAVDNACAQQEPPLTGAECEEFDPANGTAYVAFDDPSTSQPPYDVTAFGPLFYPQKGEAPAVLTGAADEFEPGAATLHGTVDPNEAAIEECAFEYLAEAEYQAAPDKEAAFEAAEEEGCAEGAGEIGEGNDPVEVHAEVSGLDPEAPYRFRLIAKNSGGVSTGKAVLFGPPLIAPKSALPVLFTEATLRAEVNPSGLETKYSFDYLDRQSFEEQGGFEGPATHHTAPAELAPGEDAVAVSAPLFGLAEGTEYLFRAVAENADRRVVGQALAFVAQVRRSAEVCPNATYRFGLSANLPDCRAYELVTPAETGGLIPLSVFSGTNPSGELNNWLTAQRGAGAGGDLAYFTAGTLPGFEGNGLLDGYRAERGSGDHPAGGWQSTVFSPDYRQAAGGVFAPLFPITVAPDQLYSIWEVHNEPETFPETLPEGVYLRTPAGFEALARGNEGEDLHPLARYVSDGGKHVIFSSAEHLEETAAPKGTAAIYDREAGGPSATVISVKPDGSPFGAGASYVGANEAGSSVAFKVGGVLYLHREGETTEIADAPNTFAGVSEGGTRVFYVAAANNGESAAPLYVCDTETGPCAGPGAHAPTEIAGSGIFALVSPDGSRALFSSTEALSGSEENENGEEAVAGKRNFYAWDGASTRFLGRLAATDFREGASGGFGGESDMNLGAWTRAISSGRALAPTRSTPEGEAFVFQSHAQLTAYDNKGVGEIYRYDPSAEAGERLLCISCDPAGLPPSADALLEDADGRIVGFGTMIANLTDDGRRVFFHSFDRLLPEDANEAEDVYEWRAKETVGPGGDECTRPGGCLALISSGQGETPSQLFAMSADGSDVFFATKEKLVGLDVAGSPSIYDAREGGGIPEPFVASPCQGDDCQGNGTPPPGIPAAATTGQGEAPAAGPPPRPPCAKGKHRVKGRCIAVKKHNKHRKHRRRGRAHANRGGNR